MRLTLAVSIAFEKGRVHAQHASPSPIEWKERPLVGKAARRFLGRINGSWNDQRVESELYMVPSSKASRGRRWTESVDPDLNTVLQGQK